MSVASALQAVRASIKQIAETQKLARIPQLVAVSKVKPVATVMEAYEAGQRHFGENYVQELVAKAPEMPPDCRWHFIGNLQSNKVKKVVAIPNLHVVETVDSPKLADALNNACVSLERPGRLAVLVQVNTSGEPQKNGCEPSQTVSLVSHIVDRCPQLQFHGLMTIGRFDETPHDDCFRCLAQCRDAVLGEGALEGKVPPGEEFIMSMGMSGDYALAIECGSNSIRVGSTIFGERPPK